MSTPVITSGKLRSLGIVRPNASTIIRLATDATLNGFGLDGDGPIKRVTGSKITIVIGPTGCTCAAWRNGEFCHHAALWSVETGAVSLPPAPCDRQQPEEPAIRRRSSRYDRRSIYRLSREHKNRRRWPVRMTAAEDGSDRLDLAA